MRPMHSQLVTMSEAVLACFCINCSEMIDYTSLDEHSFLCTRVSLDVLSAEGSEDLLHAVHLRVSKLQLFFQRAAKEEKALQSSDQNYIKALLRLLQQLLDTPTSESTQEVLKSLASLKAVFSDHFVPMDPLLLFAERVKHLATDQESAVKTQELKRRLEEVRDLQMKVETHKTKAILWQKVVKRSQSLRKSTKVDWITSELGSRNSASESGIVSPLADDLYHSLPDSFTSQDSSHLKRRFFALGIAAKLALSAGDPGLSVSLPALYAKVVDSSVPVEYWLDFIRSELRRSGEESLSTRIEIIREEVEEPRDTEETLE